MEFSIKFDTVKLGWSIVYIVGSQVIILKNIVFLTLKNSADPDEMLHYAAFHLGLYCYSKLINRTCVCLRVCKTLMLPTPNTIYPLITYLFSKVDHMSRSYIYYIVYLIRFSDNVYTCLIV